MIKAGSEIQLIESVFVFPGCDMEFIQGNDSDRDQPRQEQQCDRLSG